MKTFKDYRRRKPICIETVFGSHSIPNAGIAMETAMGKHSLGKQEDITESVKPEPIKRDEWHDIAHETLKHELTKPGFDAIRGYTDDSQELNSALWRHHGRGIEVAPNLKKEAKSLDKVFDKVESPNGVHVYTGLKQTPSIAFAKARDHTKPLTVHLPGFTSASTDHRVAAEFAHDTSHWADDEHGIEPEMHKHILKIYVPKGSKAMSVRDYSFVPHEREVLLHRGANVTIHHVPTKIGENVYMWHGTLEGHTPKKL